MSFVLEADANFICFTRRPTCGPRLSLNSPIRFMMHLIIHLAESRSENSNSPSNSSSKASSSSRILTHLFRLRRRSSTVWIRQPAVAPAIKLVNTIINSICIMRLFLRDAVWQNTSKSTKLS
uniref:(northern house mosquito) hypothetical protein n=1 Tax=Culex pipiens TaxID=7175 RepID=A0A8D8BNF7_CULPI